MAKLSIKPDSTSVKLDLFIQDSSVTTGAGLTGLVFNTASLVASYRRPTGARVAITLATQTVTGAYSSGGFVEVDATNMPGLYRFDVPDAVLTAAGGRSAVVMLKGAANMSPCVVEIDLLNETSVTLWNGTAVATPDTAGYPKVTIKSGTGTGEVSLTSGIASVNATQVNSSATAAARLALALSATIQGTVDTGGFTATSSIFETSSITEATADHFVGKIVLWTSGALLYQQALITAYSLSSGRGRFTVTTMTDAPANGDAFIVV